MIVLDQNLMPTNMVDKKMVVMATARTGCPKYSLETGAVGPGLLEVALVDIVMVRGFEIKLSSSPVFNVCILY